jgi:hypothetical protein
LILGDETIVGFDYSAHLFEPFFTSSPTAVALIQSIPVDEEARIALFFQYHILSRYSHIAEKFICDYDPVQANLYQDLYYEPVNFRYRDVLGQLFQAITRIGFLNVATARIPGAVESWIESLNYWTGFFYEDDVAVGDYFFFEFTPNSGRYIGSVDAIL